MIASKTFQAGTSVNATPTAKYLSSYDRPKTAEAWRSRDYGDV